MIDWNDPDYVAAGHFYALVSGVNVTCHDPASASAPANTQSYVYGQNASAFSPSVAVTNETTVNGESTLRALAGTSAMWTALTAGAAMALGAFLV